MPANKNALIRYRTLDRCLRNKYRRYTLEDLVDACSDALYEMEGITKGVSMRTVQGDLQMMRSDKLGYEAPIEVYDNKFYRYTDPNYSIANTSLSVDDYNLIAGVIRQIDAYRQGDDVGDIGDALRKVKEKLNYILKIA